MDSSDTFLIVPVYNEAEVVASVINDALVSFDNVVCINDGSTDASRQAILGTKAHLVDHPINLGQGAALQTGVEYAISQGAQYFITFDSDGQHRVADALKMLEKLKQENLDVVLGSRFLGGEEATKQIPMAKKLLLKLAIKFTNVSTGLKLTDTHNGLRVFNLNFAKKLKLKMSDMAHASEIIDRVAEGEFKYAEEAVTIDYTEYATSKGQPLINAVNILVDGMLKGFIK